MTTTDVIYCANGCRIADAAGTLHHVQTMYGAAICESCIQQLDRTLREIPTTYATLREHILPGSVDRNPEIKAKRQSDAPSPVRLVVVDLVDERHIQSIKGDRVIENVRGAVGIVQHWANTVRELRSARTLPRPTMATEIGALQAHWSWLIEQPWVHRLYRELTVLNRTLKDASGVFRGRPLARCDQPVIDPDDTTDTTGDPTPCGGPIFKLGETLKCIRCQFVWTNEALVRRHDRQWTAQT